jgi:hypothetical protein
LRLDGLEVVEKLDISDEHSDPPVGADISGDPAAEPTLA